MRALYEDSAVPVREIASLAGVAERTIYKYVRKGGWKRRYRTPDFAPVKGAGARFIARADKDLPVAQGLKATDPEGSERAQAACGQAELLSLEAQAEARRGERADALCDAMDWACDAFRDLMEYVEERKERDLQREKEREQPKKPHPMNGHAWRPAPGQAPRQVLHQAPRQIPRPDSFDSISDAVERMHQRVLSMALTRCEALLAEEKAERASSFPPPLWGRVGEGGIREYEVTQRLPPPGPLRGPTSPQGGGEVSRPPTKDALNARR